LVSQSAGGRAQKKAPLSGRGYRGPNTGCQPDQPWSVTHCINGRLAIGCTAGRTKRARCPKKNMGGGSGHKLGRRATSRAERAGRSGRLAPNRPRRLHQAGIAPAKLTYDVQPWLPRCQPSSSCSGNSASASTSASIAASNFFEYIASSRLLVNRQGRQRPGILRPNYRPTALP
jgi:hypothetical protein